MYVISSRNNFWDNNKLSQNIDDEVKEVNLNNNTTTNKTWGEYLSHIQNKNVLLLIHGYNNEPHDVTRAYKIIEENIKASVSHIDTVVGYTWPGGDDGHDYFSAKNRASVVANRCIKLFVDSQTNCSELHVMSHSMGCRISLLAFDTIKNSGHVKTKPLRQYLMAAAVDNESIEQGERYYGATLYDDNSYVFHSKKDSVLSKAYRLAEWNRALGYSGPENVSAIHNSTKVANCKKVVGAHGDYKRTASVYSYINNELSGRPNPQFSTL